MLSAYFNVDNGTGRIRGIYARRTRPSCPIFEAWMKPLADLGVTHGDPAADRATPTTSRSTRSGLPGFQFIQDDVEYSTRTWHTNLDVYDRLKREDLMQASVVMASLPLRRRDARREAPAQAAAAVAVSMASERIPAIKVLLLPKDTNALGTIFGGVILSHIDLASAVEARKIGGPPLRHQGDARGGVPRARLPGRHRELLHRDRARRPHLDHRQGQVEAERWGAGSGERVKVTEAEVVLVAVDDTGPADADPGARWRSRSMTPPASPTSRSSAPTTAPTPA